MDELKDLLLRLKIDEDGRLVLDGYPMILTTRNYIAFIQQSVEEVLGVNAARTVMYRAGFKSGYMFAQHQSDIFKVKGGDILKKYLHDASLRGWGSFKIVSFDPDTPRAEVRIDASIAEEWKEAERSVCHSWRGGIAGILQFIADTSGLDVRIVAREPKCIAKGDPYCLIVGEPYRHGEVEEG